MHKVQGTFQELDNSYDLNDTNIAAKMKRLKIEESHLLQILNKNYATNSTGNSNSFINEQRTTTDFPKFISNIKETYQNVKVLFQDIIGNISSQEAIKSLDISEMEASIVDLEQKIKSLKNYIQLELTSLKLDEESLIKRLGEIPAEIYKVKSGHNIRSISKYREIAPSPVRVIMNSSLKSPEVQEFQNFLSNSSNRFGGWNEYQHNIFVTSWKKYFQVDFSDVNIEKFIDTFEDSNSFRMFSREICRKLDGAKIDEITAHSKWYSRYLYLKTRQQRAIDKWKTNRILIKKSALKGNNPMATRSEKIPQELINKDQTRNRINLEPVGLRITDKGHQDQNTVLKIQYHETVVCDEDSTLRRKEHRLSPQYNKPTKQWLSRSQTIEDSSEFSTCSVENLRKLRVPEWRIGL